METIANSMEIFIKRVEDYGNTRIELAKLMAIDHTSTIVSYILSNMVVILVILFFTLMLSIGIAFWIGDLLGQVYWGFFIVAGVYGIGVLVLLLLFKRIKNTIVSHLYQPKE